MIKFTAGNRGKTIVGLGISQGNVDRLQAGQPILISLEEMGLAPYDVMIFYGETEAALTQELEKHIGPNTKVSVDPRLKS